MQSLISPLSQCVVRTKYRPSDYGPFNFRHGLGDCCNAATLFKVISQETGRKFMVHTQKDREFIFRSAGCSIMGECEWMHPWNHPNYQGDLNLPWIDNKTAMNSPVGMTHERWRNLCDTEIRLPADRYSEMRVYSLFSKLTRPIVVWHSRGATSGEHKNFSTTLEQEFIAAFKKAGIGTLFWLSGRQQPNVVVAPKHSVHYLHSALRLCDLFVGIDSGPLHLCRMTETKAIGVWFGMHPTAFAIPCPRIKHICHAGHPFDNEYGSSQRYQSSLASRRDVFNLNPVERITAQTLIDQITETLCR